MKTPSNVPKGFVVLENAEVKNAALEIVRRREGLEADVTMILNEFFRTTGCAVTHISVNPNMRMTDPPPEGGVQVQVFRFETKVTLDIDEHFSHCGDDF